MKRCGNPTCDARHDRQQEYCSRRCQVAMLNNRGYWSGRVRLPMALVHRLEARAATEGLDVNAYIALICEEDAARV